ncbi:MAG: BamA/TamA family outer membrane protein [bacterium]|nr:BamA/TamA family outer membrane protein [bacterium]
MLFSLHRKFFVSLFVLSIIPGLAFAVFGDTNDSQKNLTLTNIIIQGNTHTKTQLILQEMGLQLGQDFTREKMNEVWIHLEDIGYFAYVDMEFDDSSDEGVDLRIYVDEEHNLSITPLVQYSRRHKYLLGASLEDQNLRGSGETLKVDLAALYIQRGSIQWTHPWLMGVRGLDIKLGLLAENSNFVFRPTRQRLGRLDAQLSWNFWNDLTFTSGISYGLSDYRNEYYWDDPISGNPVFYASDSLEQFAPRVVLEFDSRSNPWYPAQGILASLSAKHWSGDGFSSYTETAADLRFFVPLPLGKHVLAMRAWGRQTSGRTQLDNLLFFGGPETIRGYQFASLEGDEGYLLSAEYRIPLFMLPISPRGEMVGLGLHAFGDAGDTWFYGTDPQKALQSWGGGIHMNIDRMQLRFEVAKARDGEWVFEFMDRFNF